MSDETAHVEPAAKPKRGRPPKAQARSLASFMREVRDAAEFADGLRAELACLPGGPDTDFIFRTAQAVFEADVARRGDLKQHIALRRLRQIDRTQDETHFQRERAIEQRERALALARERFEFDAAAAALDHLSEVRAILQDRTLKRPAKIQAVRLRLFGEAPRPAEAENCKAHAASFHEAEGRGANFGGAGEPADGESVPGGREGDPGGFAEDLTGFETL